MNRSRLVTPALCLVPALSLLAAAGCATRPEIRLVRNPAADLYSYRTFAFSDPLTTDGSLDTLIIDGQLRRAARAELERRNYIYDERHPDMHVVFSLQATHQQGTLSIEVIDARTSVLAWRGEAEGRITRKWIDDPGIGVDRVIGELFVAFPLSARDGRLVSSSQPAGVARDPERLEPVARAELR